MLDTSLALALADSELLFVCFRFQDQVRKHAAEGAEKPQYATGKFVAAHFHVSKVVANAVVRFLSRAGTLNAAPELAHARQRSGNDAPLGAASLAIEAAIRAGTLPRPLVSAANATPLPPNVFVTTGRSVRLVHNSAGYKGVRRAQSGVFIAELFDGPTRYKLGAYGSAAEAAEAYDQAVLRVRPVSSANQLNFPLERYAAAKKDEGAPKATPAPLPPAAERPFDPAEPLPALTLAEAAGA